MLSTQQSHKTLVNMLAGKWFTASSEKRAKVPLTYTGQGQSVTVPGSLDAVYLSGDLREFADFFHNLSGQKQYEQWLYYFGNRGGSFLGVFSTDFAYRKDYLINSYTGDGVLPYGSDEESYQSMYWYDWFEGTPSSGGGTEGDIIAYSSPLPIPETITMTCAGGCFINSNSGNYTLSNIAGSTYTVTVTNYQALNDLAQQQGYTHYIVLARNYASSDNESQMTCETRLYVTKSQVQVSIDDSKSKTWHGITYTSKSFAAEMVGAGGWAYQRSTTKFVSSSADGPVISNLTMPGSTFNGGSNATQTNLSDVYSGCAGLWTSNYMGSGGGGSDTPVWPVYPEPDVPSQPTQPNNVTYVVNQGDTVTNVTNNTTTTTTDLTPILEAIRAVNSNIIAYGDALNADFDTLSGNVAGFFQMFTDYFGDWMQTISGQLQTWNEQFLDEIRIIENWLEGIFYKTGGGWSSEPDVTSDSDGWWDWLNDLAAAFLGDLPDSISGLLTTFEGLRSLFPFSIPWDIAAMMALLVSQPVTPVVDIPFGYGANNITYVHVDLSAWDGVMAAVRSLELVIFAAGLALKTRSLLKNVEVD